MYRGAAVGSPKASAPVALPEHWQMPVLGSSLWRQPRVYVNQVEIRIMRVGCTYHVGIVQPGEGKEEC